ncbi:MAG: sigma-70 family RNA polymerase sigma factor [Myxococcales bacterium]|nr:sigma-70 family RNA polymerase sigma factor [Myxococcales bacterium]
MRTDSELLDAWREGDRGAGDELLRRHFAALCRFFRGKLGDDVDDLIQQTFLSTVERREQFRGAASYRSYLFAIARNKLIDHLRARCRRPPATDVNMSSLADLGTTPSGAIARDEEQAMVVAAMRRIPLDYQIALELAHWEGMSGREIADVLEINPNTVRSRLARARDALRREVQATRGRA